MIQMKFTSLLSAALGAACLAGCAVSPAAPSLPAAPAGPVQVKVIAINDFHGNLKAPPAGLPPEQVAE